MMGGDRTCGLHLASSTDVPKIRKEASPLSSASSSSPRSSWFNMRLDLRRGEPREKNLKALSDKFPFRNPFCSCNEERRLFIAMSVPFAPTARSDLTVKSSTSSDRLKSIEIECSIIFPPVRSLTEEKYSSSKDVTEMSALSLRHFRCEISRGNPSLRTMSKYCAESCKSSPLSSIANSTPSPAKMLRADEARRMVRERIEPCPVPSRVMLSAEVESHSDFSSRVSYSASKSSPD
mmetsp:Transcript_43190/g.131515  ORF Transcript_43190/g.131515 Transcript_43190/m.131515 type:complete len:235 (-) Transcript_43190:215-919(-)